MNISRIKSIDILRALTMFFMIWVNDFWSLTSIPKWLQHAKGTEDYLGFSDVIFPLFLFIMGLSIPFAIEQRKNNKTSTLSISKHIMIRSFSLLLIGVFMVNYETAHQESMLIDQYSWCFLMATAVTLIWMHWKKSPVSKKWHLPLQYLGIVILIFLAFIYKGGANGQLGLTTQWWGILGLIGWAYLINGLVYLFSKGNIYILIFSCILFNLLSVFNNLELLPKLDGFLGYFSVLYQGTIPAFTMSGILASLVLKKHTFSIQKKITVLIVIGVLFISYGIVTRQYWGISKIQGAPFWLSICTGIGFLLLPLFYFVADIKKKTKIFSIIAPAGTATLTCYMIPYFIYPIRNSINFRFADYLNDGIIGLSTSFGFALAVIIFTGWLEKKGFKLKL